MLQAKLNWKQCADLPTEMSEGQATLVGGKVYYGGGAGANSHNAFSVHCYDPSQDKWTTLPPLSVWYYSLGQINGKLVAIGGVKDKMFRRSHEIYTYDEKSQYWKKTTVAESKPVARDCMAVLSLQSTLIVAGGEVTLRIATDVVEIFRADTSQWYKTDPLPVACCSLSMVAIGNTCLALGGYKHPLNLNQALYASVDDLLGNTVPANQTTHSGSSDTQSAWKMLPNTPTYQPTAAVLAGNLLAIGGWTTPREEASTWRKEVYMYSPSTNSWIYVSDLPAPRSDCAVAVLSSTEILVIGGWSDDGRTKTVYKGTLR